MNFLINFLNRISESCFFGHRWGKWERKYLPIKEWTMFDNKWHDTSKEVQERVCKKCNKLQRRALEL